MKTNIKTHRHTWIVVTIAIILAIGILVLFPEYKNYSIFLAGIAGWHLILAFIVLFIGWLLLSGKIFQKIKRKKYLVFP